MTTYTPETVKHLAYEKARKYDLASKGLEDAFVATMSGESMGFTHLGQSFYYWKGKREESYGICQINLPSHPHITKQMATDPDFCLEWSAIQFAKGRANMWTEYRKYINS